MLFFIIIIILLDSAMTSAVDIILSRGTYHSQISWQGPE